MSEKIEAENTTDKDGNPAGGSVVGLGIDISWQNGPLGQGEFRRQPNGAFVETVIAAALQRLEFFQNSKFMCWENALAIMHLKSAIESLDTRTKARHERSVEGTHAV